MVILFSSHQVQSITERVIMFLLSQVVERSPEDEVLFSLHPRTESCKLLWRDSQVVGFYTVKHKGRKRTRMRILPDRCIFTCLMRWKSWQAYFIIYQNHIIYVTYNISVTRLWSF